MRDCQAGAADRGFRCRSMGLFCAVVMAIHAASNLSMAADTQSSAKCSGAAANTFHCKVKERKTYTVKPLEDEISHDLEIRTGEYAPYKLYMELVDDCPVLIRLSMNNKLVLEKSLPRWQGLCEPHFAFIDAAGGKAVNAEPAVCDIDGDGKPELIIEEVSEAGGHPPSKLAIYSLDGRPTLRQTYSGELVEPAFKDVDKDGKYEILVGDEIFAYWLDSAGCQSVFPKIALAYDGSGYKPSVKHTKGAPLTKQAQDKTVAELSKTLAKFKKKMRPGTNVIVPEVWIELIDRVYSGNAASAKDLLSRLYPGAVKLIVATTDEIPANATSMTKAAFWSQLCAQVKKSKYAAVISAANPGLETPPN